MDGRASFEIQTFADGRWTTVAVRETENMATVVARNTFAGSNVRGVRVVRSYKRLDGNVNESVLFSEMRELAPDSVAIVAITETNFCTDTYDFYRLPSRTTMARVFRHYLEKTYLTPTEILHNHKAMKRLEEFGNLLGQAVDRVSSLQGNLRGQAPRERRDALFDAFAKLSRRARKVGEFPELPRLKDNNLGAVLWALVGVAPAGRESYYATVSLCNELVLDHSWLGKLEHVAKCLSGRSPSDEAVAIVDGVVADMVNIPAAFQDIMGFQRNLGSLLCAIADLCEGKFDAERSDAREALAVFQPLIATGRMPETRKAFIERLVRLLGGHMALDRHDPSREEAAFRAVFARLKGKDGVFGGELVEAALKARAVSMFGGTGEVPPPQSDITPAVPPALEQAFKADMGKEQADTQLKTYPPGSLIFKEGEQPDFAYLVVAGTVEITAQYKTQRVVLARMGEGAIFGEFALFSPSPRTASAVTITGCTVRVIGKREMARRVAALDPFTQYWMKFLIDRLTDLSRRWADGKKD